MHFEPSPGSASKIIGILAMKPGRIRLRSCDAIVDLLKAAGFDLEQIWQKLKSSFEGHEHEAI